MSIMTHIRAKPVARKTGMIWFVFAMKDNSTLPDNKESHPDKS